MSFYFAIPHTAPLEDRRRVLRHVVRTFDVGDLAHAIESVQLVRIDRRYRLYRIPPALFGMGIPEPSATVGVAG